MAAAFDGCQQIMVARKAHGIADICGAGWLDYEGGMLIEGRLEESARLLVGVRSRQPELALQTVAELLDFRLFQCEVTAVEPDGVEV